jgi:hypothetical protein
MYTVAMAQVTRERRSGSYPVSATARLGAAWCDESETPAVCAVGGYFALLGGVGQVAVVWQ